MCCTIVCGEGGKGNAVPNYVSYLRAGWQKVIKTIFIPFNSLYVYIHTLSKCEHECLLVFCPNSVTVGELYTIYHMFLLTLSHYVHMLGVALRQASVSDRQA